MSVRKLLTQFRSEGKKAFVSYLTAGDPDLNATELYVHSLVEAGVDILELGVPFSDPMADGPVIQRASERALRNNCQLVDILKTVERLRNTGIRIPVVIFTYFNPLLAMGVEQFAERAVACGVDAVLTVDLPPEEGLEYRHILFGAGLETLFLASPTTTPERLRWMDDLSTGCIYYVSRTGITGVQDSVSNTLDSELASVKRLCRQPVIVGFGISTEQQARQVASLADGVVVGSALMKIIEDNREVSEACLKLKKFAGQLAQTVHQAPCV